MAFTEIVKNISVENPQKRTPTFNRYLNSFKSHKPFAIDEPINVDVRLLKTINGISKGAIVRAIRRYKDNYKHYWYTVDTQNNRFDVRDDECEVVENAEQEN